MVERLCESCSKPVVGKLFKGKCRRCYDKNRKTTVLSIPKKMQADFETYMDNRDDTAKCVIELVELGLRTWKQGKKMILVPLG